MKTAMFLLVFTASTLYVTANSSAQESVESKVDSVMKTATLSVQTIKCGSCVETITNALKEIKGIEDVAVDKKTKKAVVKYDPSKVKISDMETAVSKSGYDANEVKRDKKAYDQLDSCCK